MHDLSKWILRIMIVLGAIGFTSIYVMRNGFTIAEPPPVFDAKTDTPAATPKPEPAGVAAPVAPAPAATVATFAPCQPIGRTAKGELVYSMDCQQLPAATADADKK